MGYSILMFNVIAATFIYLETRLHITRITKHWGPLENCYSDFSHFKVM